LFFIAIQLIAGYIAVAVRAGPALRKQLVLVVRTHVT